MKMNNEAAVIFFLIVLIGLDVLGLVALLKIHEGVNSTKLRLLMKIMIIFWTLGIAVGGTRLHSALVEHLDISPPKMY